MKTHVKMLSAAMIGILLCLPGAAFGLNVGDSAPSFRANSTQGDISLEKFRGNKSVVLALYFAVFTPV
jgi:hypothetical protein